MDHLEDIVNQDEATFFTAMNLVYGSCLPMALRCAIELNLLQLIKDAGPDASLSASQLAARIPTANPSFAATLIDRILRFLAAYSVLHCHVKPPSSLTHDDGTSNNTSSSSPNVERFYSLTPMCKYLTSDDKDGGVSMASMTLLIQDRVFKEPWYHVKDVVLEGSGVPFDRAYGMHAFQYPATDPRFNSLFNQAMHDSSVLYMKKVLEKYTGFEGHKSLVDVGGGIGASLQMILSKHHTIKAINFDLHHVVQNAPSYPGIEHIGGDMFVCVPKADAIFMKWICHDWSDEHCQKLLKNCYKALPEENGKVINLETILPSDNPNPKSSGSKAEEGIEALRSDVLMLAFNPGGRERSDEEFESLGKRAGFKKFRKVCRAFNNWVMEFHK